MALSVMAFSAPVGMACALSGCSTDGVGVCVVPGTGLDVYDLLGSPVPPGTVPVGTVGYVGVVIVGATVTQIVSIDTTTTPPTVTLGTIPPGVTVNPSVSTYSTPGAFEDACCSAAGEAPGCFSSPTGA